MGGGWMGVGGGDGYPHTHAHAHTCMHMHACTHTYDIKGNYQGFPQWGLPFAIETIMFNMYMCMQVCACVRVHVHMCGGHCPTTPIPIHTNPCPKSCREPKTPKFNKSLSNPDNSILFEDSLPVNTPKLI